MEQPKDHIHLDWKKFFLKNFFSNYARTFIDFILGFLTFRLFFQTFSEIELSVYYFLWSLISYMIIFDFGLGFTIQKETASKTVEGNVKELNILITTVFWSFCILGILFLCIATYYCDQFLLSAKVPEEKLPTFRTTIQLFIIALGVGLPTGIFQEVMVGLQRIYLSNIVKITLSISMFSILLFSFINKFEFNTIAAITVTRLVIPGIIFCILCFRFIKGFSLNPKLFHFRSVRKVLSFSFITYTISFVNLIISRSDLMVISFTIGVGYVVIYQLGLKASELFNNFSMQLQELLSPASSQLFAMQKHNELEDLIIKTTRFVTFCFTPAYCLLSTHLEGLLKVLTGWDTISSESYWIGQILLLSTFIYIISSSCPLRVFVTCGKEKLIFRYIVASAVMNVVLSIVLVYQIGLIGVAIGTLIPTVLVGWFFVIPFTANFMRKTVWEYVFLCINKIIKPLFFILLGLFLFPQIYQIRSETFIFDVIVHGLFVFSLMSFFGYKLLKEIIEH